MGREGWWEWEWDVDKEWWGGVVGWCGGRGVD